MPPPPALAANVLLGATLARRLRRLERTWRPSRAHGSVPHQERGFLLGEAFPLAESPLAKSFAPGQARLDSRVSTIIYVRGRTPQPQPRHTSNVLGYLTLHTVLRSAQVACPSISRCHRGCIRSGIPEPALQPKWLRTSSIQAPPGAKQILRLAVALCHS